MALFASESFKVKSMALVVINNDAGSGYIEAFGTVFKSKGGKISENVFLDPGKVDFRTQVLKVRASKPEGVFLASTVKEAAIFIKQSKEVGFVPKWFSMTTIQSDELFKIAGSSAEGLVFVAEGGDDSDITYKTFATQYEKRFGASPTMNALNGYDAINLLVPLVAQYGGEGQKIRDGLYQTKSYKGVGGVLSFDQNGDAKKPLKLMMAKNGRFVRFE
jgi:branched-chain amino acid transport system substrate-binding protein